MCFALNVLKNKQELMQIRISHLCNINEVLHRIDLGDALSCPVHNSKMNCTRLADWLTNKPQGANTHKTKHGVDYSR